MSSITHINNAKKSLIFCKIFQFLLLLLIVLMIDWATCFTKSIINVDLHYFRVTIVAQNIKFEKKKSQKTFGENEWSICEYGNVPLNPTWVVSKSDTWMNGILNLWIAWKIIAICPLNRCPRLNSWLNLLSSLHQMKNKESCRWREKALKEKERKGWLGFLRWQNEESTKIKFLWKREELITLLLRCSVGNDAKKGYI